MENNLTQIVEALIEKISENNISINTFNYRDESLLTKAIKMENYEIAELFIQHEEYDINKTDTYKYTPLHIAARNGNEYIVELLLERGAANSKDKKGFTPQDLAQQQSQITKDPAAQEQYQRIAELLGSKLGNDGITSPKIEDMILPEDLVAVIKDEDITEDTIIEEIKIAFKEENSYKQKSKGKNTALHWAAKYDRPEVVKYLVEKYGSDEVWINKKNNSGLTALHFAAKGGGVEMVNSLLQAGAKPNVKDQAKRMPGDIAESKKHTEIVDLLLKYEEASQLGTNPNTSDSIDLPKLNAQGDTDSISSDSTRNDPDDGWIANVLLGLSSRQTPDSNHTKRPRSEDITDLQGDKVFNKRFKNDQVTNSPNLKKPDGGSTNSEGIINLLDNPENFSAGFQNDHQTPVNLTGLVDDVTCDSASQTMETTEPLGKTTSFGSMCIIS